MLLSHSLESSPKSKHAKIFSPKSKISTIKRDNSVVRVSNEVINIMNNATKGEQDDDEEQM